MFFNWLPEFYQTSIITRHSSGLDAYTGFETCNCRRALACKVSLLPQASPWIAGLANKHGIDLDTLLEGPSMEKARLRARQRLLESLEKDKSSQSNNDVWTEDGQIIEAFAFYYARLVICASEDEKLIARWAQTEAKGQKECWLAIKEWLLMNSILI